MRRSFSVLSGLHMVYFIWMCFTLLYIWHLWAAPAWPEKHNQSGVASYGHPGWMKSAWKRPGAGWRGVIYFLFSHYGVVTSSWRKWKECRGRIKIDRFGNPWISFSGEKNRKLASTAEYITELELRVGTNATSFSLSLFIYTRSDSRPFTAHTSYLSTRVAWQIHCVLLHELETQPEFPQTWHLPL